MVICTLGDLLLDVIVRLRVPLAPGDDVQAASRAGAGGQAANVAAWAAELGAEARLVCKRADDEAGRLVATELAARGVEVLGPVVQGRTGVVVSLVEPGGERSLVSDRGVSAELRADELDVKWFAGCDLLHVSGYALKQVAARVASRISVDLSTRGAIDEQFRTRFRQLRPDVVFATEIELEAFGPLEAETLVVKHGAAGFTVNGERYSAAPAEVVDTTGAGDALAAGFLVGGPELAREAAARCVAGPGAMP